MVDDFYIRDLGRMINRWKFLLIIFPILGIAAAWYLNTNYFKPMYEASSTMLLSKVEKIVSVNGLVYDTVLADRPVIKTYSEVAKSESVLNKVIDETGADTDTNSLRDSIDTSIVGDDTGILKITVDYKDPEMVSDITNSITKNFIDSAEPLLKVYDIQVIDKAETPQNPISPNKKANLFIGAFLGLLFSLGLIFLVELRRYFKEA